MNDKVLQVVGEVFSILFAGLLFLVAYVGVIQRLRRGPAAAARAIGDDGWGPWFRQNFDKLLLFLAWLIAMLLALHMMKTSNDASNIAWWREVAGTVLGAFLGLVTGSRMASSFSGNTFSGQIPPGSKIVANTNERTEITPAAPETGETKKTND